MQDTVDFDVFRDQSNGHALEIPHARQETTSFTVTEYAARYVGAMDGDSGGGVSAGDDALFRSE